MRITAKMLDKQIEFLNKVLGRPPLKWESRPGEKWGNFCTVGSFTLGAQSPGDGWTRYSVEETVNDGGGVKVWYSGTGAEVFAWLRGAYDTAYHIFENRRSA